MDEICSQCGGAPADPVFLAEDGAAHICGECWVKNRHATADYAADLARLDAVEQRIAELERRFDDAAANNARMLALIEKLYKMQSAMVNEIRDRVAEIRASLPHAPMTINQ